MPERTSGTRVDAVPLTSVYTDDVDGITKEAVEDADSERVLLLADILRGGRVVHGLAHAAVDLAGVWEVYLSMADGSPVFATMLVTPARLETMLAEAPTVVEGTMLQVLTSDLCTVSVMRAGMEAWAHRNFASLPLSEFRILPWDALGLELSEPSA